MINPDIINKDVWNKYFYKKYKEMLVDWPFKNEDTTKSRDVTRSCPTVDQTAATKKIP